MKRTIRFQKMQKPELADQFYPKYSEKLNAAMAELLNNNDTHYFPNRPHALIVPHSGFRFSGAIAATAMREIRHDITRVVILSPSHRLDFEGIARPEYEHFTTPVGRLSVSPRSKRFTSKLKFVHARQDAFSKEQGIELMLPWIKRNAPNAVIAPFVIGRSNADDVEKLLRRVWGNNKTLIIISTDLEHFRSLRTIQQSNETTAIALETGNLDQITAERACGWLALRGFLKIAREQGLRIERLATGDSFATHSDLENVVGYGAWAAHEPERFQLPETVKSDLYEAIAISIWNQLNGGGVPLQAFNQANSILGSYWPCFVKLTVENRERRRVGALLPQASIFNQCMDMANSAAFGYRGAKPVTKDNFDTLECEIEITGLMRELGHNSRKELEAKLDENKPGVVLSHGTGRVNFLPEKWKDFASAKEFLDEMLTKMGYPQGFWEPDISVKTYFAESLGKVRLKDYVNTAATH